MITYYKFRGKQYKTGEWLVGDLIHFRNDVMILPLDADWFDFVPRKNNPLRLPSDRFVVDKATVGQFTGLHDKNGKEIYEGDIIKIVEEFDDENVYTRIGVVCFEEGMYELQDKNGKHFAYLGWLMHDDAITKLEVIGNIHDNPELLEKGGQNK